jgi:hypothetical protein
MGKVNIAPTSRRRFDGKVPQIHRQLGRDLLVGQIIEQLELGPSSAIDENSAVAAVLG